MKPLVALFLFLALMAAGPAYPQNAGGAFTNSIGMQFVHIPAGSFFMGSPPDEPGRDDDERRHQVILSKDFYIAATEVTQEQFETLMGYNPSAYKNFGKKHPVEQVSWNECRDFITKLNRKERTNKYRLPTEAEWEYACRAGTTTAFSSGEIEGVGCGLYEKLNTVAWYCGNSDFIPHEVARKQPNPWGIYDMHGNVMEWCLDQSKGMSIWSRRAVANTDTYVDKIVDPLSRTGEMRILRGGSWNQSAEYARSADRSYFRPVANRNYVGFRIVMEK